jgi:hypothetical protein
MIRPVTEIAGRIDITVHHDASAGTHQLVIQFAVADQSARCAIRLGVAVVDLAGCKPAIRHRQQTAVAGDLVGQ